MILDTSQNILKHRNILNFKNISNIQNNIQ